VIFSLKAIPGGVVTTILSEGRSGYPELRILGEFLEQKLQIVGIEGQVSVKVTNNVKRERADPNVFHAFAAVKG
jgi:hypothetical protein